MPAFSGYFLFLSCLVVLFLCSEHSFQGLVLFICLTNLIYVYVLNDVVIATGFARKCQFKTSHHLLSSTPQTSNGVTSLKK